MNELLKIVLSSNFYYSILRLTTPILFAALGALVTDRAGVMNIGLEGMMLAAALAGVVFSAFTKSALIGVLGAILIGIILSMIMSYFSLMLDTDIILTGIALNLLASGGTIFVLYAICKDKGMSTSLASLTVPILNIPIIEDIRMIGNIISGHNLLTYLAFIFVFLTWVILYKTPLGLRIRIVGENPKAAESVGINVKRIKTYSLILSGIFASLGGAYMSMGYMDKFARDMTAGRGFIALAAETLGRGTPIGSMISSLGFGLADALATNLQILSIPVQFIQMIPYICTIVGLIMYSILRNRSDKKVIRKIS